MKLVIGYDGSDFAGAAIDDLRYAGLPPEAEATVVTVVQHWLPPSETDHELAHPARTADALTEPAQELSTRAADRLRSRLECRCEPTKRANYDWHQFWESSA